MARSGEKPSDIELGEVVDSQEVDLRYQYVDQKPLLSRVRPSKLTGIDYS